MFDKPGLGVLILLALASLTLVSAVESNEPPDENASDYSAQFIQEELVLTLLPSKILARSTIRTQHISVDFPLSTYA